MPYPWWMIGLAVIGVIAIGAVLLTLFSNVGEHGEAGESTSVCPIGEGDFVLGIAGIVNAPLQRGGTARLLNNGDEFYPVMLEAIRAAEKTINFMVYIWEPGKVSDMFFDALTERARAGVQVRLMIDAFGGHNAPEERVEALKAAGGKWCWFHPPRFGKITLLHRRNHRRVIVIDGKVGFTGGAAVDDQWLGSARNPEEWRDSMVEVRGCVATNLQAAFAQLWASTGELLVGPDFFPADHDAASAEDGAHGDSETLSQHINVVSSPSAEDFPLRRVFWLSFRSAQERIWICNPYFVPDHVTLHVLLERARAGVDVRIMVPNEHIDVRLLRWAAHHHYEALLEAGVRVWEYQPTMIHQKHVVCDGLWSIMGSANMDVRSKELNQENILGLMDRGFAEQVEATFRADLERSREIHLDEWRRRPALSRVAERFAALFEEQF